MYTIFLVKPLQAPNPISDFDSVLCQKEVRHGVKSYHSVNAKKEQRSLPACSNGTSRSSTTLHTLRHPYCLSFECVARKRIRNSATLRWSCLYLEEMSTYITVQLNRYVTATIVVRKKITTTRFEFWMSNCYYAPQKMILEYQKYRATDIAAWYSKEQLPSRKE